MKPEKTLNIITNPTGVYHTLISSVLILSIASFYFSFTYNDQTAGFLSDDAVYLLLADLYSFQENGSDEFYEELRRSSYFPPAYPMILGLFGGGSSDPARAALLTVTMLVLAATFSYLWMYSVSVSYIWSVGSTVLLVLLPASLIFSVELWSEFLFMIFIYGALTLISNKNITGRNWVAISLLIALATLTRSVGISLAIAFIVYILIRREKHAYIYSIVALLPFLVWNVFRELFITRESYIQTFLSTIADYSAPEILGAVASKISTFYGSFIWLFASAGSTEPHRYFSSFAVLAFLFLILCGFISRIRRFEMDSIFLLLYMSIIFMWPYDSAFFVSRFIFPLVPLFFYYCYTGILCLFHNQRHRQIVQGLTLAFLFISTFPSTYQYITRAYATIEPELAPYRRDRQWLTASTESEGMRIMQNSRFIIRTLDEISVIVPEADCIFAIQAPIVMLYSKRITGIPPAPDTDDNTFASQISACKYILSMPINDLEGVYPVFYPMRRLSSAQFKVASHFRSPDSNAEIFLIEHDSDPGI